MTFLMALGLIAAQASASTLQQEFDAATQTADAGKCAQAVALFEALERKPQLRPGSIPAAAVAVRKGKCLIGLAREAEGEAAIFAGLPRLEQVGASFTAEVADSYLVIGSLSLRRANYTEARQRLQQALVRQTGSDRLLTLGLLTKATSFDPGPEPLAYADEALRIAEALPGQSKDGQASYHTLRARVLLNRGQTQEGYAELKKALALSGGLTLKTSLSEAAIRGDLALAALLLGKKDDARLYLAWTGAGRIERSPFDTAASMAPPDCGGETGLRPEDYAVVGFSIADDGSVDAADTIFTRGGPRVAAAFSRAVRDWYWLPESLAKIPPFYRLETRVEMRCSTSGGQAPSFMTPLYGRFADWASPLLGIAREPGAESFDADRLNAMLAQRESAGDGPGQAAVAGLILLSRPLGRAQALPMLDKAILAPGVPAEQVNALRIMRASAAATDSGRSRRRYREVLVTQVDALEQDPVIAADSLAINTLRVMAASPDRSSKPSPVSDARLRQVVDDPRLEERHPLRQVALLRLANSAAAAGDVATAQGLFARTGLSEQQCALLDVKPAMRRSGADASDFPMEAMRYGFEGWVKLEFDITADGRTAKPRALIAYPPFVFVDAATGMTRDIRYETSYRPSGGTACSAFGTTIKFTSGPGR